MKLLLLALLLDTLVLSQQFFTVVFVLFLRFGVHSWLLVFLRLAVIANELFVIGVFRKGVVGQVDQTFLLLIRSLYFFSQVRFVVAYVVDV